MATKNDLDKLFSNKKETTQKVQTGVTIKSTLDSIFSKQEPKKGKLQSTPFNIEKSNIKTGGYTPIKTPLLNNVSAVQKDVMTKQELENKTLKQTEGKSALATLGFVGKEIAKGYGGIQEGIAKTGGVLLQGLGKVTSKLADNKVGEFIFGKDAADYENNPFYQLGSKVVENNVVKDLAKPLDKQFDNKSYINPDSLLGRLPTGVGNVIGTIKNPIGGLKGTAVSAFGTGASEAQQKGGTFGESLGYGALSSAIETGTESLFGGLGKTFGVGALDDFVAKGITKNIANKTVRILAQNGIKAIGEGAEEVIAGALDPIARKLTFMSETKLKELYSNTNLLEDFIVGSLTSAIAQTPSTINETRKPNLNGSTQTNVQSNINTQNTQEQALNVPQTMNKEAITPVRENIIEQPTKRQVDLTLQNAQSRIPTRIGSETSKLQKNVETSPIVDTAFSKLAPNLTYDPISNVGTMAEAKRKLDSDLDNEVVRLFNIEPTKATVTDVAQLIQLQYNYQKQGNIQSFQETINKLREVGTSAGQAVQAFAIMQRMTPEGMVYYAQKDLQDIFDTVSENKSKKWMEENKENYNLTDKDITFIKNKMVELQQTKDVRKRQIILGQVQKLVNDKIPSDIGREIKSFRRVSMLFNPKTQIRNIVGNATVTPLNIASDLIGSGIDKAISKTTGVRTVAPYNAKEYGKGFKQGAKTVVEDYKMGIDISSIQGDKFEIGRGKNFNEKTVIGKTLNKIDRMNSMMLRMGDNPFFEAEFNNSLQNQMKLNKVPQPTADMVEVATQTALERTWQDNNKYTQAVVGIRNILNKVNVKGFGLGDTIIPFAKTPANITKAMVDYSPLGLAKSLALDIRKFKNNVENGKATPLMQKQLVTNISKGMTGSLVYLLAYGLRDLISGSADEDKDIRDFMRNTMGVNPYSFKIGDSTFTYDWAQPISTPFAIVADSKNKEGSAFEKAISSLGTAGDRLIEQSFLQGIKDLFSNFGQKGATGNIVKGIVEDLPSSFVPTVVKQINDTIDKYNRQTYASDDVIGNIARSIGVKLPTSKTMDKRYDTLGKEVLKYGGDNNIFNAFINPANVNKAKNTEVGKEILNVYEKTGDKTIFPRIAPYSIKIDDENKKLTTKQQSEFQKISGTIANDSIKELLNDSEYKKLDFEDKAEVINGIIGYSYNKAKSKVFNTEMSKTYKTAERTINNNYSIADFYLYKAKTKKD